MIEHIIGCVLLTAFAVVVFGGSCLAMAEESGHWYTGFIVWGISATLCSVLAGGILLITN